MADHYSTLGIDKAADTDQVKRAYRQRASRAHPDKGGSTEEMAQVNKAYAVLADPEKRKAYDETGKDDEPKSISSEARDVLMAVFAQHMRASEGHFIGSVLDELSNGLSTLKAQQSKANHERATLAKRRDKIKHRGEGQNLAHMVIDQQLGVIDAMLAECSRKLEVVRLAINMANTYESGEELPGALNWGTGQTFRFGFGQKPISL
jgi:DnaJ-class molecular chaperone